MGWTLFILVATCVAFLFVPILAEDLVEFNINSEGGFEGFNNKKQKKDAVQPDPNFKSVTFQNNYKNQTIYLYWESDSGDVVKMGDIDSFGTAVFNSFIGHNFFATSDESGEDRVVPRKHTVVASKSVYQFGPSKPSEHTKHPLVKLLNTPTTACSAKFRNHIPITVDIYYEDGRDGSFQGTLDLGKEYTINTYEGHVFYFTEKGDKSKEVGRFTIDSKMVLYVVEDPLRPAPEHMLLHRVQEEAFGEEYLNRTGLQWRHYYGPKGITNPGPRGPPTLFMWPTEEIGQIHGVTSPQGFWTCDGDAEQCQSKEPVHLELEVVSQKPKVFIIPDFLSDFEVDAIKNFAKPKVARSSVGSDDGGGARNSDTRTSRNTWVPRRSSKITETLSLRAADLLNIDEKHLYSSTNAEDLQVVHYVNGQKYDSHHDWGVSGYVESRYITLLLYLTDMAGPNAGGETSFPKGAGGLGFKVSPKKGTAVLFYNLLEDGNGDDLALHAALPVHQGEKWLANFWVWDPKRK